MQLNIIRKTIAATLTTAALIGGMTQAAEAQIYDADTFDQGFTGLESPTVELYDDGTNALLRSGDYLWLRTFDNSTIVTGRVITFNEDGIVSQLFQFHCDQQIYRERGSIGVRTPNGETFFQNDPIDPSWKTWDANAAIAYAGQDFCDAANRSIEARR